MNFIVSMFSETAEQARLVTTIIAALIAVLVVLLTHRLNNKKYKKENLVEKIEEMYSVILSLRDLERLIYLENIKNREVIKWNLKSEIIEAIDSEASKLFKDYNNKLLTAEMLANLYFKNTLGPIQDIKSIKSDIVKQVGLHVQRKSVDLENLDREKELIESLFECVFSELEQTMKKTLR
ncbi:hypothetical protein BBM62_02015 [Vibrio parahaemolyticus]|uniref:hypothetical protein n=1 Tax=Vibrio parahaemolyticus TaxID=670 RepID=UPI00084B985D|nr:hypothetical protein [Vibrio parahaemolyticus]EJD0686267.1 hypothetical protein [Vibrio parahaemolyticus]EJI6221160.1 hypothetical protein [Vibrio parahaemolyticus]NNU14626.1 hypothetical protein [Vibrio parahaemolyticus]OEA50286.1 hypothetical protein BBM62_02015 [Vibrio parahaemolyticus]